MSYYVSGYYQEKAILKKEGQLFFLKCEEADAPAPSPTDDRAAGSGIFRPEVSPQRFRLGAGRRRASPRCTMPTAAGTKMRTVCRINFSWNSRTTCFMRKGTL